MKEKTKIILSVIITFIVTLSITVTASLVTNATNITYTSDKTDKTNVNEALDELYDMASNQGYTGIVGTEFTFDYVSGEQKFQFPYGGKYKIELWGAQGADYQSYQGGKGSYVSATVDISINTVMYLYVGQTGPYGDKGYNGGGRNGYFSGSAASSGGGATDIRLVNGEWNNNESLYSRLMIAAGGGGGSGLFGGGCGFGAGGSGGSSYVKKCEGCNTDYLEYQGNYVFSDILMLSGEEEMPDYTGDSTMTGNSGNGFAKITYLG